MTKMYNVLLSLLIMTLYITVQAQNNNPSNINKLQALVLNHEMTFDSLNAREYHQHIRDFNQRNTS